MSRSVRETYLGMAAGGMTAGYLLAFAAIQVRAWGLVLVPAFALLQIARVVLAAGFGLATVGMLWGKAPAGARRGARAIAAGCGLIALAFAIPPFSRFGQAGASPAYLAGRTAVLAGYLAWLAAALLVARALAPWPDTIRRNELRLAGVIFASGSALRLVSLLIGSWGAWIGTKTLPVDLVAVAVAYVLLAIAGAIAALAFSPKRGSDRATASEPAAGSQSLLAAASGCVFLASVLEAASVLSVLGSLHPVGRGEATYYVLRWVSQIAFAAAPLIAAIGFARAVGRQGRGGTSPLRLPERRRSGPER